MTFIVKINNIGTIFLKTILCGNFIIFIKYKAIICKYKCVKISLIKFTNTFL